MLSAEGLTVDYNTKMGNGRRSPTVERAWGLIVQTDQTSSVLAIHSTRQDRQSVEITVDGTSVAATFITVANEQIHIPDQSQALRPSPEEIRFIKRALRHFAN